MSWLVFCLFTLVRLVSLISGQETAWSAACSPRSEELRFDCHPDANASLERCATRGCCWSNQLSGSFNRGPACYFPQNYPGFQIIRSSVRSDRSIYWLRRNAATSFIYPAINDLKLQVIHIGPNIARIVLTDSNNDRFEVPNVVSNRVVEYLGPVMFEHQNVQFGSSPGTWNGLRLRRSIDDKDMIFDSSVAPLIYSDKFIQISSALPSQYVYGLGEHRTQFQISANWRKMSFWTRDQATVRNDNLYGNHPVLMSFDREDRAFGYFMLNANAMETVFTPMPSITYRTIGGIIDMFVFFGPTPDEVINQYWSIVGRPLMAPYWSLGYHLSRWGYNTLANLEAIVNEMKQIDFPYDVQWTDIDALDGKRIFTYDKVNWANLPAFVQQLHREDKKWISINDPGIACNSSPDYLTYQRGLDQNVYVKWANNSGYLIGEVWPGLTVYPDWTHPNAVGWWTDELRRWNEVLPQDGLWIDMNEVSSFIYGSIDGCPLPEDNPIYVPDIFERDLWAKTICVSAQQHASTQYNLHSLYGHQEAWVTHNAFTTLFPGQRPFILTRSSFSGSGSWTSKWGGDNFATFNDMYYSLTDLMNFNIFGFTLTGDDVCGFIEDTTPELCTRWHQAGLVYTFFRNHNIELKTPNHPSAFEPYLQAIMKNAEMSRYELLPYMYTLLYKGTAESYVVHRSLMFEYPEDRQSRSIDSQILLGPGLMSAPVFHDSQRQLYVYFPLNDNEQWFEFPSGRPVSVRADGEWKLFDAPLDTLKLFLRSGYVIPTHIITNRSRNAIQNRNCTFRLYVGLGSSSDSTLQGNLFWDDGVASLDLDTFSYIRFYGGQGYINIESLTTTVQNSPVILQEIVLFGVTSPVRTVIVDGNNYKNYIYNGATDTLTLIDMDIRMDTSTPHYVTWE